MISSEVQDLINSGYKIKAIKLVREQTGLGLKEAKELVEATPKTEVDDAMYKRKLQKLIADGDRTGAIHLAIDFEGIHLVEAVKLVDTLLALGVEKKSEEPEIHITFINAEEVFEKKLFGGSKLIRRRLTLVRYTDEQGEHEITQADGPAWARFHADHRKAIETHMNSDVPLIY
jgi:hypothetical protein